MNILAIGAHPDDLELGCFGVLSKHKQKGDKIFGIILTKGEHGSHHKKRESETKDAAKLIGLKLKFGNFPDGELQENLDLVSFLDEEIKKNKIDVIYTHSQHDRHQDHIAAAKASISASRDVKEVFSFESPSVIYPFNPQFFVDITDTLPIKIKAIKKHKSQMKKIYMRIDAAKGLAKFRALQCRIPDRYCEAFEIHKILKV